MSSLRSEATEGDSKAPQLQAGFLQACRHEVLAHNPAVLAVVEDDSAESVELVENLLESYFMEVCSKQLLRSFYLLPLALAKQSCLSLMPQPCIPYHACWWHGFTLRQSAWLPCQACNKLT